MVAPEEKKGNSTTVLRPGFVQRKWQRCGRAYDSSRAPQSSRRWGARRPRACGRRGAAQVPLCASGPRGAPSTDVPMRACARGGARDEETRCCLTDAVCCGVQSWRRGANVGSTESALRLNRTAAAGRVGLVHGCRVMMSRTRITGSGCAAMHVRGGEERGAPQSLSNPSASAPSLPRPDRSPLRQVGQDQAACLARARDYHAQVRTRARMTVPLLGPPACVGGGVAWCNGSCLSHTSFEQCQNDESLPVLARFQPISFAPPPPTPPRAKSRTCTHARTQTHARKHTHIRAYTQRDRHARTHTHTHSFIPSGASAFYPVLLCVCARYYREHVSHASCT